jgi:hypothetical protein
MVVTVVTIKHFIGAVLLSAGHRSDFARDFCDEFKKLGNNAFWILFRQPSQ